MTIKNIFQLLFLDHTVAILVYLFKHLQKSLFVSVVVELRSDVSINHCFQLVLKME